MNVRANLCHSRLRFTGIHLIAVLVTLVSLGRQEARGLSVVSPALGRPTVVAPAGVLAVVLDEHGPGPPEAALIQPRGGHRYPLRPVQAGQCEPGVLFFQIEANTPEATYDLSVRRGDQIAVARHSVCVRRIRERVRVVQLSPMRLGSPCAARIPEALAAEINAWRPDLVVMTSDYVDPLHPAPGAAWDEVARFICSLDVPVFASCGPMDDLLQFTRMLAPSPSGELRLGQLSVLGFYSAGLATASENDAQLAWMRKRLLEIGSDDGVLVVMGDGSDPAVRQAVKDATNVRAILCTKQDQATPLSVRGGEQLVFSTAGGGRSREGVYYRVIDLAGGKLESPSRAATLLETGSIEVHALDTAGAGEIARARIINRLPFQADAIRVTLQVKKGQSERPWVLGGALVGLVDCFETWACAVETSIPGRGAVVVRAGTGERPAVPRIVASWEEGGAVHGSSAPVVVLRNESSEAATLQPVLRCGGEPLRLHVRPRSANLEERDALTLGPGESVALEIKGALPQNGADVPAGVQVYPFGSDTAVPLLLPPVKARERNANLPDATRS